MLPQSHVMKALSVRQLFASWIAEGKKTIESRTWRTNYRGPLLICSGKAIHENFNLHDSVIRSLPRGIALAKVTLTECRPIQTADEEAACCEVVEDDWAWILADVKKITPFPVKGRLHLFEVPYNG